jgi:signal transduction histidine kinase
MKRVPGTTRARWLRTAYTAGFSCYLAGLLLWLGLGLVPPLTSQAPMTAGEVAGLATQYLFSLLNLALGVLLAVRRPDDVVPRLVSIACLGTAATFNAPSHEAFHLLAQDPVVMGVHFAFHLASGVAYLWAVLLFPDGRLPARGAAAHRLAVGAVLGTLLVAWVCWRSSFIAHPPFFVVFFGVLVPVVGMAAQTARLRLPGEPAEVRQQSRLLRLALAPALTASLLWIALRLLMIAGFDGVVAGVAAMLEAAFPALFAVVPVMLFVAVLRYRLWDIDVVLSRTLLVVLLTGVIGVVYAAVLALTARFSGDRGWSLVGAMTVTALVAEPARQGCQRVANRVVFGQELTPREAMRALSDRLSRTGSSSELADLTAVVVAGTRCSSAAVWVIVDHELLLAARHPDDTAGARVVPLSIATLDGCRAALTGCMCVPVLHEGKLVAVLAVMVPPGVRLPNVETRLLEELAGHAGLLVANARLTQGLAHQLELVAARSRELHASRRGVVQAQDEERRRLERDIHDGAQQELVAFILHAGILQRSPASPCADSPAVQALHASLTAAVDTLQELAAGHAPRVLADRGLQCALDEAASLARAGGLDVGVTCRLGVRPPAEVEAAVYFCVREALQNVAKHARAQVAQVDVASDPGEVCWSVSDDGVGLDSHTPHGSGLDNLRDRAMALGGTVSVDSPSGLSRRGTRVSGRLPVSPGAAPAMGVERHR